MSYVSPLRILLCLGFVAVAPITQAQAPVPGFDQSLGNTPGRVLQDSAPTLPDPNRAPLEDRTAGPRQQTQIPADQAALSIRLTNVVVEGNTVFEDAEFDGLWRQFVGSEVTIGQLANVADDVQTFYRREGYVFTRAILLQDGFEGGVATIRVVEGVLGEVTVEESAEPVGPVLDLLQRMGAQLEGVQSPHISDLERVLLLMNEVPGITRATAIPRRATGGADPGVVNITINVERKATSGVFFAENRQAPSAGRGLLGLSGQYASYTSGGDTTSATYLNSFWSKFSDLKERHIFQLEHSRYLTSSGLILTARGLYSQTDLGDELEAFGIEGEQYELGLEARYPLVLTRPSSVDAYASFDYIESENDILDGSVPLTRDSLRVFTVGLDALERDSTGFTEAGLGLSHGVSFLGGSEAGDALLSRADGDPNSLVVFGSLERDQQLFVDGLSANVYFDAQWASDPQVASREYQAGGTTIGRGYDPSELTGDHGYGVSTELRYTHALNFLGIPFFETSTVQLYGFYDYARVFNIGAGSPKLAEIASYGGGLRFELPEDIRLQLEVAKPLEELDRNNEDEFRIFFEAQKRF